MSVERPAAMVQRLAATVDAPRLARAAAAELLARLGSRALARADDLALVVSELVTNAVVHGPAGELELRVSATALTIRVEVADAGVQPFDWPAPGSSRHRGLDLVGSYSDRFGSLHEPNTVAWCELDFATG